MPITTEQRLINDRWLLNIIRMTRQNWIWPDTGHIVPVKDKKLCPITKQAYRDIIAITTISFVRDNVVAP